MRADRNIVDVNILLADKVEQQIERPFVNVAHHDREREVALRFRLLRRRHLHHRRQRGCGFRLQTTVPERFLDCQPLFPDLRLLPAFTDAIVIERHAHRLANLVHSRACDLAGAG